MVNIQWMYIQNHQYAKSFKISAQPPRQRRQILIRLKRSDNYWSATCEWPTVIVKQLRQMLPWNTVFSRVVMSQRGCDGIKNESVISECEQERYKVCVSVLN